MVAKLRAGATTSLATTRRAASRMKMMHQYWSKYAIELNDPPAQKPTRAPWPILPSRLAQARSGRPRACRTSEEQLSHEYPPIITKSARPTKPCSERVSNQMLCAARGILNLRKFVPTSIALVISGEYVTQKPPPRTGCNSAIRREIFQ